MKWVWVLFVGLFMGCSLFKTKDTVEDLDKIVEFDKKIQITELPQPPQGSVTDEVKRNPPKPLAKPSKKVLPAPKDLVKVQSPKNAHEKSSESSKKLPELEDSEGFLLRRPLQDPFRVGEKVVLSVKYFGVTAGDLNFEVGKMVEFNGRKSYVLMTEVRSNPSFAIFYEVNDVIKTFLDYQNLIPLGYTLHIRETNDVKEGRGIFDWESHKALSWTKTVEGGQVKEEKEEYPLEDFSQSVYSAIFYMRTFSWRMEKQIVFRVHDKGKTLLFKGQVLRKEALETALGIKNTLVIKPEFELDGIFKPVGDIYFWLTDDDRKFVVRIESKIKIGRLVGELKSITPGQQMP